jgi:hypothetical protein
MVTEVVGDGRGGGRGDGGNGRLLTRPPWLLCGLMH